MQALLKFSRAIDWLNGKIGQYAIWLIFGATAISAINAVIRKAFNYSSNGFLEVQWYLFAWSFLIAAGFTLLKREHVRIDVLNSRLSKRSQVWIDIVGFALFLTPLYIHQFPSLSEVAGSMIIIAAVVMSIVSSQKIRRRA